MIREPTRSGCRVRGSVSGAGPCLVEVHIRNFTWR